MKRFILFLYLFLPIILTGVFTDIHAAPLTGVTDTPSIYVVSTSSTTHTITFITATADTIGKVTMFFKPAFTLSNVFLDTATGISTGAISVSGNTVTYSITYPDTISGETLCTIKLSGIDNAPTCGMCTVTVSTWRKTPGDTFILIDTGFDTFFLTGNVIKFITPPQVLTKGDTSLAIRVIASDASGNTDVTFNNTVTISTSSDSGKFSVSSVPWQDTTIITLLSGVKTFYYRDTALGEFAISASRAGYTSGEQGVKTVEFLSIVISPNTATSTVISQTALTTVTVPTGAFSSTVCIIITEGPSSETIANANNGAVQDPSKKLAPGLSNTIREIIAFAVSQGYVDLNQPLNPVAGKSVTVTIPYSGTITGVDESGLRFCRLDENTQGWILVSGTPVIDKNENEVSMNLTSLSVYRLIIFAVSSNLSEVIVYPNPFEMEKARDGKLKFIRLPTQVTIKIYNLVGELVKTLTKDDAINRLEWDGKNEYSEKVASGIYFYVITSAQDATRKVIGKFAVIGN